MAQSSFTIYLQRFCMRDGYRGSDSKNVLRRLKDEQENNRIYTYYNIGDHGCFFVSQFSME
jgi:hypothetical protein